MNDGAKKYPWSVKNFYVINISESPAISVFSTSDCKLAGSTKCGLRLSPVLSIYLSTQKRDRRVQERMQDPFYWLFTAPDSNLLTFSRTKMPEFRFY